jgi:ribonuclease Y
VVAVSLRQARERRQQLSALEQTLTRRDEKLTERLGAIEQRDKEMRAQEQALGKRERATSEAAAKYERLVADQQRELQRVAGLTADEARETLIKQMEADARRDAANLVKRLDAEARETAAQRARQLITEAIQRSAAEHTTETTVSVVDLPSDDLKGRIIGREGRNIRALEIATGVDLIVDDTPGAIILSGFDPYRREIAKLAIERLIADGRIHPARIEEVVEKVKAELDEEVRKQGEAAAFELGLHDLHPEVLRLMGRLRYRTSYGQNVLNHSKEVAFLAGTMARELGLQANVAVRAAFLHDIGKAIDREMQGTHLEIGLDFLRKHGEQPAVLDAVAAHHMDIDWPSLEAMIVQAADAISAARPGARRDILESYVKRLEKLEGIADSFKGVSKAFALQAGREIRIMVESERITDEEAVWLSKDIARRIENELEYPGQIKVTVIRETRAVEYAK